MTKCQRLAFLVLVKQPEDHFGAGDVKPVGVEMRVRAHTLYQGFDPLCAEHQHPRHRADVAQHHTGPGLPAPGEDFEIDLGEKQLVPVGRVLEALALAAGNDLIPSRVKADSRGIPKALQI